MEGGRKGGREEGREGGRERGRERGSEGETNRDCIGYRRSKNSNGIIHVDRIERKINNYLSDIVFTQHTYS